MEALRFFLIACVSHVCHGRIDGNTDWQTAKAQMFMHRACDPIIMSPTVEMIGGAQCGSQRCNFPSQTCVADKASAWLNGDFITTRCHQIPPSCIQAVNSGSTGGGSSGGGGSFTTRFSTRQPFTQTQRTFPPRGGGGSSSGGSSGSGSVDCNAEFDRGIGCGRGGGRPGRVFHYHPQRAMCLANVYRGCGGNSNRFTSQSACEAACKSSGGSSSGGTNSGSGGSSSSTRCSLPRDRRTDCSGRFAQRYWSMGSRCTRMWSKCSDNGQTNLFNDEASCKSVCG